MEDKPDIGKVIELTCIGKGKKGDGICKHNGLVVIVPEMEVGQTGWVEIKRVLERFAIGELQKE